MTKSWTVVNCVSLIGRGDHREPVRQETAKKSSGSRSPLDNKAKATQLRCTPLIFSILVKDMRIWEVKSKVGGGISLYHLAKVVQLVRTPV